jgi:hypothetical protein
MNALWMLHPGGEVLSRLADQSQLERRRSRAGRHVDSCPTCTAAIASLHALGQVARAMPDTQPTTRLWARIEAARLPGDANSRATSADHESSPMPMSVRRSVGAPPWRRVVGIAAVATIAVVSALLWPSRATRDLLAASPDRLVLSPTRPTAGSRIDVRFIPGTHEVTRDTLWLAVTIAYAPGVSTGRGVEGGEDFRYALLRSAAGDFRASFDLPIEAAAAVVDVGDLRGRPLVANSALRQVLVTSTSVGGRPRLDALERASALRLGFARQQLATEFTRWAPDHPLRYVLADDGQPSSSILDWVRRFTMRQRTLGRLDEALRARTRHRAFELLGMIDLAYALEEPGIARYWTDVLVREHPEEPRTLLARTRALHQMELDGTPRDSIAALLPLLDTLYVRSGGRLIDAWAISSLVRNVGDSASVRRWMLREIRGGAIFSYRRAGFDMLKDAELADSAAAWARETIARRHAPASTEQRFAQVRAYSTLAGAAYWRGDAQSALAFTDSAWRNGDDCLYMSSFARVAALLALGDTLRAEDALAERSYFPDASPDSARALLGPQFDAARWKSKVAAAESRERACRIAISGR